VPVEEVSMNANPNELVVTEEHTDVVHEMDLVEVGKVSAETKGSALGVHPDGGQGVTFG
jgi:hypothetical protein